ncbi:hypothetical protein VTN49DRAFT_5577 [Thermomyces lanuginosus]|uniref:uncharacterized protein n=1 Tax=Thermomyces lanuginosus TaxID=5541 RepID=UPI0037447B5D
MVQWFKNAGFVDIRVENFVVLYGVWPKTSVYGLLQAQAEAASEGGPLAALKRYKQWSEEEAIILASQAHTEAGIVEFTRCMTLDSDVRGQRLDDGAWYG